MPAPTLARRRARLVAAFALAAAVAVGACSAPAPSEGDLAEALETSGLPADVAECASKAVHDSLSDDELREIAQRGGGAAPTDDPDRDDDAADQVREALAECRDLLPTTTVPTTTAPPTPTTTAAASTTEGATLEPADG